MRGAQIAPWCLTLASVIVVAALVIVARWIVARASHRRARLAQASHVNFRSRLREVDPQTGRTQAQILRELLGEVVSALEAERMEYFASFGTLLGLERHAGHFVPWDDDVDLVLAAAERPRVMGELRARLAKRAIAVEPQGDGWTIVKVYYAKRSRIRNQKFSWPFIDLFFYEPAAAPPAGDLIETRVRADKVNMQVPRSAVFPVQHRTFEGVRLAFPRDPHAVLDSLYEGWRTRCMAESWGHITHARITPGEAKRVSAPCRDVCRLWNYAYSAG